MSAITKSAKGQECQARIPGICRHDPETTVFSHLNGAGIGNKHKDLFGCYACHSCHTWLDGGYANLDVPRETRDLWHLQAIIRTQVILLWNGLVKI